MKLTKIFYFALVATVMLALCGCSSNHFKLKAHLKGLGSQNVKVVYVNDEGAIVENWITAQSDHFEVEGSCANPSLLLVYNSLNVAIFKTVVSSGDEIEIEGKVMSPNELKVEGSEAAKKWSAFVSEHKGLYGMIANPALNAAIEKYVKDNRKSLVSTLLVLVDYSPTSDEAVDRMLDMLDDSAKPASLLESYNMLKAKKQKPVTSLKSLNMMELTSQDFEAAVFTGSKPSVILFWDKEVKQNVRTTTIDELKMLDANTVQILDVNIDSDSAGWNSAIRNDGTNWKHYWVPGSLMNHELLPLQLTTTPTIIVTDTTGHQLYRGNDAAKARQTIESL